MLRIEHDLRKPEGHVGKLLKVVFTFDIDGIHRQRINSGFEGTVGVAHEYGQKTAENFENAWNNTLTPKKKVELIGLSSEEAEAAGQVSGSQYAKGFVNGLAMIKVNESGVKKIAIRSSG